MLSPLRRHDDFFRRVFSKWISASARLSRPRISRRRENPPTSSRWISGEIGTKRSSAQLPALYRKEELVGRQVAAVVNFAPRQIGPFLSEVLVLGFPDGEGRVVLIGPERAIPNGGRLF